MFLSIKKILFLMGLSVLLVGCSTGTFNDDMNASGRHESNTDKGVRYLLGRGVPRSDTKAFSYFSQGAKEDDPFAENELAYMYAAGKGTPRDYEKALKYYQEAADHGLASAQYNLGLMYWNGMGTEPNRPLAMQWFKRSAAHGFLPAKKALARNG